MKKTLLMTTVLAGLTLAGVAQAADLPIRKAPAPLPPPVFSWTGFYIGAHVGAGWGTKEWSDPFECKAGGLCASLPIVSTIGNYNVNGFLGGGQIGYNWQSGSIVFGVEADASWTDIKGHGVCFFLFKNCSSKVEAVGTITGKLGFAIDRALIYAKGGGAWINEKHDFGLGVIDGFTLSDSHTRWGWVFGTGVEYAFMPNWSAKIEYNYMDFGTKTAEALIPDSTINIGADVRQNLHTIKFGINYRFGGGGIVANY